ncbi:MAG TPA: hypothetical protein VLT47_13180 [Anaeromyxobacteraceae bacterium]|nr:hypothetical protein [Anaeromyxobacteraceae bacterium]
MIPIAVPLALAAALGSLPAGGGTPALPSLRAAVTGRLRFEQGGRTVTVGEAQRLLGGRRIGLTLRSGWEVAPARLGADGQFTAEVAPGSWRIEWIDVGDGAEFLPTTLEAEARDGRTTCIGQITVAFDDVQSELGSSSAGTVTVEDRCGELGGGKAGVSLAHPGGDPAGDQLAVDWMDVAAGLRTEAVFQDEDLGLRVAWSIPFRRPLAWQGNLLVSGAVVRYWSSEGPPHEALEVGGGLSPFNGIELSGGLQVGVGGGPTAPWANLRWGGNSYALNARAHFEPGGVVWSFGFDLTPFHVLGSFL